MGSFHERFELDNVTYRGPGPREVDDDLLSFRAKFLWEEFREFMEAMGCRNILEPLWQKTAEDGKFHLDHEKAFDALLDLVYVAMGTAHLLGYPWQAGWDRVQQANMKKVRATEETASERGGTFDVIKPEGWTAPDLKSLLEFFDFEPNPIKENTP